MTEHPRTPIRVLIADDEPLARQRIADLLAAEDGMEIVGTAATGDAAVEEIRRLRPDLVFLDVQMPGKTGLEVVREIGAGAMPATIFMTAYDRHAVAAFELEALDYLVKPFDDDRFEQAVGRVRRQLEARAATHRPSYADRIAVDMRGKVRVVPVEEIRYITADGPYAELHTGERPYVIRESMQALEERLDPRTFFRVHRSAIVRVDQVQTLLKGAGGDYEVLLRDGTRLRVSRARREALEQRLGAR